MKLLLFLFAAQALTFNAFADEHKRHNVISGSSEVEDLAPPGNITTINSYQWVKEVQSSRKAVVVPVITSPLMTAHSTPAKVMSAVNTTLIFWGKSWSNTTFASDKIVGLNLWYNTIQNSTYKNTVSEYTAFNHILTNQKIDALTAASSNSNSVLAKVCSLVGSANVTPDGYYPVYTDIKRGNAGYCAYHSAGVCGGKTIQFAFFFNLDNDSGCNPNSSYAPDVALGPVIAQSPGSVAGNSSTYQQSQGLAALANVTAHELMETVTNNAYFIGKSGYWGGWFDSTGAENGDKCAWTFGPSNVGSAGTVSIGGFNWKLQGEWSNSAQASANGYPTNSGTSVLNGCVSGS